MTNPNCLIIAGEKSGEEHCLSFFPELKSKCPNIEYWGVGGEGLAEEGFESLYHLKDFSSWGVSEVIGKIPFYFNALKTIEAEVVKRNTKVAILIDFQDFNLRLAKKLKKRGVKVLYYVAPQAWAWKAWRAKVLGDCVHTLFTIIPFEQSWFRSRGVQNVEGVNHPLWLTYGDKIDSTKLGIEKKSFKRFQELINIVLLPGSRNFEVSNLLPEFISCVKNIGKNYNLHISLVKASNVKEEHYLPYLEHIDKVYEDDELPAALEEADFSLAASGTVTLATALFEVPTVVSYKSSLLNEFIFYTFLDYSGFISLANIVHQKKLFPELIQNSVSSYNIKTELLNWIENEEEYVNVKSELAKTSNLIQGDLPNVGHYMGEVLSRAYE